MTRLSLAVAAPRTDSDTLVRFLDALDALSLEPRDELSIALTARDEGTQDRLRALLCSRVRGPVSLHPSGTNPMRLWGWAMARSRGEHVAVLEVRDPPVAGWARAWAAAPADRIVCGPVNPGPLCNITSWAAYLSEYGQFREPLRAESLEEVPGNNVVFPRRWLPPAEELEREGFWKTLHLERLRRELGSLPVAVAPEMSVVQHREYRLASFLRRRALHGWCYGGSRVSEPSAPPRWLCLGFAPLLPGLRVWRLVRRMRAKPGPTGLAGLVFPAIVLGEIAWSLGEFRGYASGPGDACERIW